MKYPLGAVYRAAGSRFDPVPSIERIHPFATELDLALDQSKLRVVYFHYLRLVLQLPLHRLSFSAFLRLRLLLVRLGVLFAGRFG